MRPIRLSALLLSLFRICGSENPAPPAAGPAPFAFPADPLEGLVDQQVTGDDERHGERAQHVEVRRPVVDGAG